MLNKHNLAIVGDFASTKASRYTLTAIQVTEKETIATNGHYLVRVTRPMVADDPAPDEAGTVPFLIEGKQAKEIGKALGKVETAHLAMNGDTGRKVELTNGTTFHAPFVPGTFPNVEAVMPAANKAPILEIGVNADYLMRLARAFGQFQPDSRAPVIKLTFYSANEALKMEATNDTGQKMTAILMPTRV